MNKQNGKYFPEEHEEEEGIDGKSVAEHFGLSGPVVQVFASAAKDARSPAEAMMSQYLSMSRMLLAANQANCAIAWRAAQEASVAAQREADAIRLAARAEAAIVLSRAEMDAGQVRASAGVTEAREEEEDRQGDILELAARVFSDKLAIGVLTGDAVAERVVSLSAGNPEAIHNWLIGVAKAIEKKMAGQS